MRWPLIALAVVFAGFFSAGCGEEGKASNEDKANLERLGKEGLVPEGSKPTPGDQGGVKGEPVNGKVDPP